MWMLMLRNIIQKLLEWTDANCTDVIADKALGLLQQGNNTPLKDQLFSSLSLLLDQNYYFAQVSDLDFKPFEHTL